MRILVLIFFSIVAISHAREYGDLISYELIDFRSSAEIESTLENVFPTAPQCDYDVALYKIVYETVDIDSNLTYASASVGIPQNQDKLFPLVAYFHGTTVMQNDVTSVHGFDSGEGGFISMWLGTVGTVILIPDYLGLGVSEGLHPYQLLMPSASSSIDAIEATKQLVYELGVISSEQLFLCGYSEGGYVTMATQKIIEENPSLDIEITASAPCAGAYDMSDTMYNVMISETPYGAPYYLPYVIFSYNDYYNIYDSYDEILKPEYASILPEMFYSGEYSSTEINNIMPNIPMDIVKDDIFLDIVSDYNHPIRDALRENDLYDWSPQSRTRIYHSTQDELVPVENAEIAYNQFIANGSDPDRIELAVSDLGTHQIAAPWILISAYYWFQDLIDSPEILLGDMDLNNIVDVLDVIILVNIIVENVSEAEPYQNYVGDINSDEELNVLDVISMVNIILNP